MGIFGKKGVVRKFQEGDVVTVVGPEAYFHGVLTVRGSLRVEGEVEGSIHEAQTVIVGAAGRVHGDITAASVVVGGSVQGDIVATERLEIIAGGKVTGNVRAPKIQIEDEAYFEGNCAMNASDKETGKGRRAAKPEPGEREGDKQEVAS